MNAKNVALQVAHDKASEEGDGVVTLSTGYRAWIKPVASSLITDATSLIKDPPVPMWMNDEKERLEPNPFDPEYQKTIANNDTLRASAVMDCMTFFGVELVDGLPIDTKWLAKLKYLEKRGKIDLSTYDLDDPMDQEFLFLRYVAVAQEDLQTISVKSGITKEGVDKAKAQFQSDEERTTD